jgi:GNAT superfamily N-acetyltransferase
MQPITIRTALVGDQEMLESIQWRASLNNPGDREALLAHPDAIELSLQQLAGGGVFVAEIAGIAKGFAAILPHGDGAAELDALFVEPAAWRQGIGRALVEHCCSSARAAGAAWLHVIGNPHAEHFYASCGFESLGTRQMRFGVGLVMRRDLR